ncbi:MAG TPA: glutathione peroxidase [Actinocrinis sp.]|uniref:glutathione peroxidase n=1 Tax=Actinocrinis sp. TaxID=1920516 RepID=UPI002DDCAF94|nr:glutathione peroxidase [Actinocrinis sp.]HEV2345185.1 glutathione peroxidase [Actinocrinis sp.]
MGIKNIPLTALDGSPTSIAEHTDKAVLVVNVASQCGLTPQYTALEELHKTYSGQGFSVVGFPCNQFGEQEPGTAEEIATFCSTAYGVTFPLFSKIEVNGENRNPVYDELTQTADTEGYTGDIRWNFEKFLLDGEGNVVARFNPRVEPDDPRVVAAIKALL